MVLNGIHGSYPLVNVHKKDMDRSTVFNGKFTIWTGPFSIALLVITRD